LQLGKVSFFANECDHQTMLDRVSKFELDPVGAMSLSPAGEQPAEIGRFDPRIVNYGK
jgi:hypothetical protein